MSGAETLLEAKRLEAWYGAAQILFELDLHVNRGEVGIDGAQRRGQIHDA